MPNWVMGYLNVKGPNSEKVIKNLLVKEDDEWNFDFNKIIPMPESLNVTEGTVADNCIKLFMNSLDINHPDFKKYLCAYLQSESDVYVRLKDSEAKKMMKRAIRIGFLDEEDALKTKKDVYDYGKKLLDNIIKYGHKGWYEWRIANWGTKSNAYATGYDEENPTNVSFETAWADVRKLIFELSKLYPENTFYYEYAEECAGDYAGFFECKDGKVLKDTELAENSKEAYEMYFALWGDDDRYQFDKKKNTYVFIDYENEDDEEME